MTADAATGPDTGGQDGDLPKEIKITFQHVATVTIPFTIQDAREVFGIADDVAPDVVADMVRALVTGMTAGYYAKLVAAGWADDWAESGHKVTRYEVDGWSDDV